ncbi:alpha/beta fold hydrolase [Noviherbaspirillum sp. UKPF54]|uniref:alpha/beta fold hydrolase n=1 Tax=Noviherbaspirillum sp. UKPF54 TaxID=2601898 RepID=UPI0011B12D74|nr:alpha/beta fold hydrolase [Noviherbaspirillum sp. UKPF54]QDZ26852.1 alpha/beta hydrolase [Noviherbaspirillum sp. UKPF54]
MQDSSLHWKQFTPGMHSELRYRFRKVKRGALARLALLSSRFDPMLKTAESLLRMEYPGDSSNKNLIVFLPGIGDLAEDFERNGFIADLRHYGITADAVAVDAHYGYYASRAIHARIAEDVVDAAQEAGYERIWLAGISLGGFGASSFAALTSSRLSGLLLLAPYLGNGELVNEIASAGGVRQWKPGIVRAEDYPRAVWAWLKENCAQQQPPLPIYLGYGAEDMFADANALLADVLPESQVYSVRGGHNWATWKKLWPHILAGSRAMIEAPYAPASSSPVSGNIA